MIPNPWDSEGSFAGFANLVPYPEINSLFATKAGEYQRDGRQATERA